MKQIDLIEQRKKELLLEEKNKDFERLRKQKIENEIDEFWDNLLLANSRLDPIIRLSVKTKNEEFRENCQTIGPLVKKSQFIQLNINSIPGFEQYSVFVDRRTELGIFESDINVSSFNEKTVICYYNDENGNSWSPFSIFYDFSRQTLVVRIIEGRWHIKDTCANSSNMHEYEISRDKYIDILLNNIIAGHRLSEGLQSNKKQSKCFLLKWF